MDDTQFVELLKIVLGNADRSIDHEQLKTIRVEQSDRVLQILAGPGSGKTEVLVWRVLYDLFVNDSQASELLVTTFTRRAATELEVRLVERTDAFLATAHSLGIKVSDPQVHDIRIGTIHSLCDELLAEFDSGYMERGIQLVDEAEIVARLMRHYRYQLGYDENKPRLVNRLLNVDHLVGLFRAPWEDDGSWPTTTIDRANFINQLISQHTETWIPRCGDNGRLNGIEVVGDAPGLTGELSKLQGRWETYLLENNILDYGTIQKRFVDHQPLLEGQFRHVFVDEFQDSNPIQFRLHTFWLNNSDCRLTVVGDDDQAIYRFRGSDLGCFESLNDYCSAKGIDFRQEKLEINYRSTTSVVSFCQLFKTESAIINNSMPKKIVPKKDADIGSSIRMLEGPWRDVCAIVAEELETMGVGKIPSGENNNVPSVGILMFSTSERTAPKFGYEAPGVAMKESLQGKGLRIYNPRSKTAADPNSPVGQLLGLISYLIDPIAKAPAGKSGNLVEVYASHSKPGYVAHAESIRPSFYINSAHISYQKKFRKELNSKLDSVSPERRDVLNYIDNIREELIAAKKSGSNIRLTMAGFVSRLLSLPFFRNCGFTINMFRQSLFTQLLESNIAPTRLSKSSLDAPLDVIKVGQKFHWDDRYWKFLSYFGAYINDVNLDDLEVDSFEENAVPLITFHQSKGLEFDAVYVAGMGRDPDIGPALRTALFSGDIVPYNLVDGLPETQDVKTIALATADRDREVYVALTRAKQRLTLLLPTDRPKDFSLNKHPTIGKLFKKIMGIPHTDNPKVMVKEWQL